MKDLRERCDDAQWWSRLPDLYPVPTGTPDADPFRFGVGVGRSYRSVSGHLRRKAYKIFSLPTPPADNQSRISRSAAYMLTVSVLPRQEPTFIPALATIRDRPYITPITFMYVYNDNHYTPTTPRISMLHR